MLTCWSMPRESSSRNIGSMWAQQTVAATPSSAYSMAKAGLHSLTQHLAMELGGGGIRVNAVSPAVVRTPIYEEFIPKEQLTEAMGGFDSFHPVGRTGTPEDVASTVLFLLSPAASWLAATKPPAPSQTPEWSLQVQAVPPVRRL
jgi:NAD(P)-dependent dehydrogenase (short-subunit alcohol dehydrogenase family)